MVDGSNHSGQHEKINVYGDLDFGWFTRLDLNENGNQHRVEIEDPNDDLKLDN